MHDGTEPAPAIPGVRAPTSDSTHGYDASHRSGPQGPERPEGRGTTTVRHTPPPVPGRPRVPFPLVTSHPVRGGAGA